MIIVNLTFEESYDPETDGYHLELAAVVNDTLDLFNDVDLIKDCIENDTEIERKGGSSYVVQLLRATIDSDPIPEPAFIVGSFIQEVYDPNYGWITPTIKL